MRLANFCGAILLLWLSHTAADVFKHPVSQDENAAQALRQLSQTLAAQPQVKGSFSQQKFLSILERPLRSHGSFQFHEGTVVWAIEEPFAVTYSFSEAGLQKQDDAQQTLIKPADDPILYGFFAFFSSVFDMSQSELEKLFDVYFQQDEKGWVLALEPRNRLLRESIATIIVEGSAPPADEGEASAQVLPISEVTIRESNGDYSQLLFNY